MELLTNPWFILINVINIALLIYLGVKFHYQAKQKPLLFEKLREQGLNLTVRKPSPSNQKGEETNCNKIKNP